MLKLRKILCPTDFSACSTAAMDYAVELARTFAAEVVLLHVVPEFDHFVVGLDMVAAWPQLASEAQSRAAAELEKARGRYPGMPIKTEVRLGATHPTILGAAAAHKADLVVLGTHGRTGAKHLVLGSIAERIVRHCPVPVLTVRHGA